MNVLAVMQVDTRIIKIKDLAGFAADLAAKCPEGIVPIIRNRAFSLALNPQAAPDDPALFLGYEQGLLSAYIGVMPVIFFDGKEMRKIYWGCTGAALSTRWGSELSDVMLDFAKKTAGTFTAGGANPHAWQVYRRNEFREQTVTHAVRLDVNTYRPRIPSRLYRLLGIRPKSRSGRTDKPANAFGVWLCRRASEAGRRSGLTAVSLGSSPTPYIADRAGRFEPGTFFRPVEVLVWMINHPWWPGEPAANTWEKEYFFGALNKKIEYDLFELRAADGQPEGFGLTSVISDENKITVKLLDHAFETPRARKALFYKTLQTAADVRADFIVLPPDVYSGDRADVFLPLRKKILTDSYFVWSQDKGFLESFDKVKARLTDGDLPYW